jgi:geranylgeranyl diphosphate synthase type 3
MSKDASAMSPFASPNAIPPRTSSHGIIVNGAKPRPSVLRPLSEIDWMSQSTKSKRNSSSTVPVQSPSEGTMTSQQSQTNTHPTPASRSSPPPPPHGLNGNADKFIYGSRTTWTDEKERILTGPYDYLVGHPGKDVRSQFIAAFNKWLKVPEERLEVITRVVGMLHTASLLYASRAPLPEPRFTDNGTTELTMLRTLQSSVVAFPSLTVFSESHRR